MATTITAPTDRPGTDKQVCRVEDCDRPSVARGWCRAHYQRWYRTGDVRPGLPIGGDTEAVPVCVCPVTTVTGWGECTACHRPVVARMSDRRDARTLARQQWPETARQTVGPVGVAS